MSAEQADRIQKLLCRLMDGVRQKPSLTAEVARAEREFFQANPKAMEEDPAARFRFQEWYLLERPSELLGDTPITCPITKNEIPDEDYDAIAESMVGVFLVTGGDDAEYVIQDLQSDAISDLCRIDGVDLEIGDVLVGRLYLGSLDVYIASAVLCCQRDATELAEAFRDDVRSFDLDRRLTQAEIEHLMFRGRGTSDAAEDDTTALPDDVPLERLEADLEGCLVRGGEDEISATDISAALRVAVRPGIVMNPLLEQIAFDSDVDLELAQRLMVQIWSTHQSTQAPPDRPLGDRPPLDIRPTTAEPPSDEAKTVLPAKKPGGPLGAEVARRLQQGLDNDENMADVFADIDAMVGKEEETTEPSGGRGVDGDLRPLITEYLWETGRKGRDQEVLEQMVLIQCETSVPRLELEAVTSLDLIRLFLQTYLAAAPGERAAAVGEAFAVISRFYDWVEETQKYEIRKALEDARAGMVEHTVRLETAALALSGANPSGEMSRGLFRVVTVGLGSLEIVPVDGDKLVRLLVPASAAEIVAQNLAAEDLLLGELGVADTGHGSFGGMVVAMPSLAHHLLG